MKHLFTPQTKVPFFKSLKTTLFVQAAVLVSLTIFCMVVTAFFLARAQLQRNTLSQLQLLVSSKEDLLENILSRQREHVAVLASDPTLASQRNVRRLLGLSGLFLVQEGSGVTVLQGSDDATVFPADVIQHVVQTTFIPQFSASGLDSYLIVAPLHDGNGHLVASFDARPILSLVLTTQAPESGINLVLGFEREGELQLLRTSNVDEDYSPLFAGAYGELLSRDVPLAKAVSGLEGNEEAVDYAGVRVLTAYRSIPSIGWGLVASIDRYLAFEPVRHLALTMFSGGLAIVTLSVLIVWSMAGRITFPLLHLQRKLQQLETKRWQFARDIFTQNEIEVVDAAAHDLASRLRDSYEHLEDKVAERTKELREAHAKDRAIFQSMEHGLLVADNACKVVLMNEAAVQLTEWPLDKAIGEDATSVLAIIGKDGTPMMRGAHPLLRVLSKKEKFIPIPDPGYSLCEKDGAVRPLHMVATPVLHNNACIGVVAVFRDMTEERRIDKMKSEFIALASHQLRTPISSIRWYIEMLLAGDSGAVTEEQQHYLREIGAANNRMIRLAESLLNVANLELGTFILHAEKPLNILAIIQDEEDSYKFDMESKAIKVVHHIPKNAQDATTCLDEILFRLVYQNIFGNAVKYTPQGGSIDVTIAREEAQKKLIVSVKDTGIGIPKDQQLHIFEKLFRADNAREVEVDGTGLGLYIAANAAKALGAEIACESDVGKGAAFTLKIPLSNECVRE